MVWVVRNLNGSKRKTRTAKEKSIDVQKNGKECFFAGICSQTVVFNQYTIGHPFKLFIDNLPEFFLNHFLVDFSKTLTNHRANSITNISFLHGFASKLSARSQSQLFSNYFGSNNFFIKIDFDEIFSSGVFLYTSSIFFGCTAFLMGSIFGVRKFCCSFLYFTMIYKGSYYYYFIYILYSSYQFLIIIFYFLNNYYYILYFGYFYNISDS